VVSVILILFVGRLRPQAGSGDSGQVKDFTDYRDGRIPELMKEYDIPGVNIALIRGGMMVWSSAYGNAIIEERRPMTVETRCRVESISKVGNCLGSPETGGGEED
jgi:CubicO group peptidase (beta-lactamase class C family)